VYLVEALRLKTRWRDGKVDHRDATAEVWAELLVGVRRSQDDGWVVTEVDVDAAKSHDVATSLLHKLAVENRVEKWVVPAAAPCALMRAL